MEGVREGGRGEGREGGEGEREGGGKERGEREGPREEGVERERKGERRGGENRKWIQEQLSSQPPRYRSATRGWKPIQSSHLIVVLHCLPFVSGWGLRNSRSPVRQQVGTAQHTKREGKKRRELLPLGLEIYFMLLYTGLR